MKNSTFFIALFLLLLFFSCSGKISVEEEVQSEANVLAWTKKGKALTSLDIQQDNILNVLYVEHDIYGLIKQLGKENNPNIEVEWFSGNKKIVAKTQDSWQYDTRFPDYLVAPDGKRIVAVDTGNRIRLFDDHGYETNSFKILKEYKYSTDHTFYNTDSADCV